MEEFSKRFGFSFDLVDFLKFGLIHPKINSRVKIIYNINIL